MPCYEVRTVSIEFKIGNVELLKKALSAKKISFSDYGNVLVANDYSISLESGKLTSTRLNQKELASVTNGLKRAYSEIVIDEVARKQKWIKKSMGNNAFQLQRF